MPGGDQTGPLGLGPMTGGGWGYCSGYAGRGAWSRPRFGRGAPVGGWTGGGRGYRHRFYATGVPFSAYGPASEPILEPEQETSLLAAEAERLRSMLESIEKRLERLKNE